MDEMTREQQFLIQIRKLLSAVIRDTTPPPGLKSPLSQHTVEDMRACLLLIATRERELAEARGVQMERPFFADDPPNAEVVPIASIQRHQH